MLPVQPEQLTIPNTWPIHYPSREVVEAVRLRLFKQDGMFFGDDSHYLSVGASALYVIESARRLAFIPTFSSILDFGSGAGRVTRWLRAAYPGADLTTSDLLQPDLEFCADTFDARIWMSDVDIDALRPPVTYDLIWAGSVLTHISAERCIRLLNKFAEWISKDGLIVASYHGRFPYFWRHHLKYIDASCLPEIERCYEKTGFGYGDYPGQKGYGISFCQPSWIATELVRLRTCQIVLLSETAWDTHHDVLAVKRTA